MSENETGPVRRQPHTGPITAVITRNTDTTEQKEPTQAQKRAREKCQCDAIVPHDEWGRRGPYRCGKPASYFRDGHPVCHQHCFDALKPRYICGDRFAALADTMVCALVGSAS
jgi:hypothetical protein